MGASMQQFAFARAPSRIPRRRARRGRRGVRGHRAAAGAAGRRQELRAPQAAGAGGDRQEDRGDRVLLLRLPALRRARAVHRHVARQAAAGRAVPPRAGVLPGALGEPRQGLLHARRAGRGGEAVAGGVRGDPRRQHGAVERQDVLRLGGEQGTRPQEGRGHVQLVRDQRQDEPREAAGADVQHPVGADGHRRRQVRHRVRQASARTRSCRRRSTS